MDQNLSGIHLERVEKQDTYSDVHLYIVLFWSLFQFIIFENSQDIN